MKGRLVMRSDSPYGGGLCRGRPSNCTIRRGTRMAFIGQWTLCALPIRRVFSFAIEQKPRCPR